MNIPLEVAQSSDQVLQQQTKNSIQLILGRATTWMSAVLIFTDMLALVLAGFLAVELRFFLGNTALFTAFDPLQYARFSLLALLFVAIYFVRGLYPGIGLGAVEEFRRLVINTTIGFLSIATFLFALHAPPVFSRLSFVLTWIFALALVPFGRALARAVCARLGLWGEPVVLVGDPRLAAGLAAHLRRYPKIGLKPILACADCSCPIGLGRAALARDDRGYAPACRPCPAREVRTALAVYDDYNHIGAIREKYRDLFERVILVNHTDSDLSLSSVSVREFGGLVGLEIHQNLLDRWAQVQKRVIDLVVSGLGILVLSPFLAVVAACIYIDSPGRIFYRQTRMGKNGRAFKLVKFRTMHLDADRVLQHYLAADPRLKREWDQYQKLHLDPRITRVGRILRRFSVDELPQLWNVFKGQMSLVGPRPIMENQVEVYGAPYEHYIRVTPGVTGLWQVSGRNKTTFARRAEFDVQYVMNWSIWLDLYILVRTVYVVLRRDGAS